MGCGFALRRTMIAGLLGLGLGSICLAGPGVARVAAAAEEAPRTVAEKLDAGLLEAMKNAKTLGYDGRYRTLEPVLAETFDFPFMARVSVGRHWRKMSEAEQARLVKVFARLSIATFAARFDGYGGETFEIAGEEPQPRGAVLVLNRLIKTNGKAVGINLLMREGEAGWRIIDVFLDAKFSELATKRSEYTAVIERDGFPGLLEAMEKKIANFAATSEG
ncbi:MAG: ABC transporter substrate-binding protein [Rhodospirillales bacterium]|nr:ABC transporter substrate-binding protein [Rhodospirillales bacterium]